MNLFFKKENITGNDQKMKLLDLMKYIPRKDNLTI